MTAKGELSQPSATRRPMVAWYDPGQLAQTGLAAGVSALLGTRADHRLVEALAAEQPLYDYANAHDEVVIDYVADTGDGYASTRAIAEAVRDTPVAWDPAARFRRRAIVLGGDQVYPTATRREYEDRFVLPWTDIFPKPAPERLAPPIPRWGVVPPPTSTAPHDPHSTLPGGEALPDLLAIPGNHDWYDGLASFTRLFTQGRTIGGLRTCQRRSYFALRLPGRWWMLALDIQLEGDIDGPQLAYFRDQVFARLDPGDRVIVCVAEPAWEKAQFDTGDRHLDDNLAFIERLITARGGRVHVWLAGDLHYYRRWTTDCAEAEPRQTGPDSVHKITCGGGGAFLHPTHTLDPPDARSLERLPRLRTSIADRPALLGEAAAHPPRAASRRLSAATLLFPLLNPSFGVVPAILYFATAAIAYPWATGLPSDTSVSGIALELALGAKSNPILWVWVFAVLRILIAFAEGTRPFRRALSGALHGTAHLALAAVLTTLTLHWLATPPGLLATPIERALIIAAGVCLAWTLGSVLFGAYLFLAVRFFRAHTNEAFSALHFQGYKSFLRIHIRASGDLRIEAYAVDDAAGTTTWQRLFRDGAQAPVSSRTRHVDSVSVPARPV
ncbi:MAG: hypothetical protein R3F39_13330 [Myxococcota bacterium]